jgi:hypothetical protein
LLHLPGNSGTESALPTAKIPLSHELISGNNTTFFPLLFIFAFAGIYDHHIESYPCKLSVRLGDIRLRRDVVSLG